MRAEKLIVVESDDAVDNLINIGLSRINTANGANLSFVPTIDYFGALAVRPEDGVLFGTNGDQAQLLTINPTTGAETLIGGTGRNFIGDIAFQTIPEPGSLALLGLGFAALLLRRRKLTS